MPRSEVIVRAHPRRRGLRGMKFRRQHPVGPYIADFACVSARLIVEGDGAPHWTEAQLAQDARRTRYLESQGWRVARVTSADVYENMDGVWMLIELALSKPPPPAGELVAQEPEGAPPPPSRAPRGLPPLAGEEET